MIMTDGIKSAIGLRESWLRLIDADNFGHVVSCLENAIHLPSTAVQNSGQLQMVIKFSNNVPKEQWFRVLETHLSELGYVVESRKPTTDGSEEMRILF